VIVVDPLSLCFWKCLRRSVRSCHMVSDSGVEELHGFAAKLGVKRSWFQAGSVPHYDLTSSMRRRAVAAGAREVSASELVCLMAVLRGDLVRPGVGPGRPANCLLPRVSGGRRGPGGMVPVGQSRGWVK
jgi:hypothetical protein